MNVYVFGAGASAPYGAPVTTQLLARAFSGWSLIPPDRTDYESELTAVGQAINQKYGTHLARFADGWEPLDVLTSSALRKINVEDLIAHAEQAGDEQLLNALHVVLFKTIEKDLAYHRDDGEYERLVKHVAVSAKAGSTSTLSGIQAPWKGGWRPMDHPREKNYVLESATGCTLCQFRRPKRKCQLEGQKGNVN